MKLNLTFNHENTLSGFVNINPFLPNGADVLQGDTPKIRHDFTNLDQICDNSECETIIADYVLSFYGSRDVDNILNHWISKLRHNGKLIICDYDIYQICKGVGNYTIDLAHANALLYGTQANQWNFRRSLISSADLAKALQRCGLKIYKNRINNFNFVVEANRP
jgi:hypothetical protein